ncbi:ubiquitin-specific protease ubp14 [Ancistrocladus abbreviatus]
MIQNSASTTGGIYDPDENAWRLGEAFNTVYVYDDEFLILSLQEEFQTCLQHLGLPVPLTHLVALELELPIPLRCVVALELELTELTTAERELDRNTNFDWNRIQESGQEMEPLFGPGYTGLINLGNR